MRIAGSIVLLCFLTAPSLADKKANKKADPRLSYVDDEPMSHHAATTAAQRAADASRARATGDRRTPDDVGQLRSIDVRTPAPSPVDSGPRGATADHAVVPPTVADATHDNANAEDVMTELAARQLAKETRRHQRDIDGCIVAAQRRHPAAVGTVTVALTVADHAVARAVIRNDAVDDIEFSACLVHTARTFKFSLAAVEIAWPVTLTPSAAR